KTAALLDYLGNISARDVFEVHDVVDLTVGPLCPFNSHCPPLFWSQEIMATLSKTSTIPPLFIGSAVLVGRNKRLGRGTSSPRRDIYEGVRGRGRTRIRSGMKRCARKLTLTKRRLQTGLNSMPPSSNWKRKEVQRRLKLMQWKPPLMERLSF